MGPFEACEGHSTGLKGLFKGKDRSKAGIAALLCLFKIIWQARTRITFDNNESLFVQRLNLVYFHSLLEWIGIQE